MGCEIYTRSVACCSGNAETRDPSPALRAQDDAGGLPRAQDDERVTTSGRRWLASDLSSFAYAQDDNQTLVDLRCGNRNG